MKKRPYTEEQIAFALRQVELSTSVPDEWQRVPGIVFADETVDGGLKVDDGMEDAMLEPAPREFGEESGHSALVSCRHRQVTLTASA